MNRILLVEDDEALALGIEYTLSEEGYEVVLGLDLGGDDYVTKPFRVRELLSRIRAVLRRAKVTTVDKNLMRSGDIIVNTSTAEVTKLKEKISLTAQEYKLLLIFMNNAMKLLSKDKLLDEIFEGEGAFVDENTLSVYVKRLREKLEDKPSTPKYIITKRGLGYKWNIPVIKE